MRPCILLADDHSFILAGIRSLLEGHYDLVGQVSDGRALVEAALRLRPDVTILDVTMPLLNGIDAARQIRKEWPQAKLLFLTMHAGPVYLREAMQAGGLGYVLKSSATEELRTAIQKVPRRLVKERKLSPLDLVEFHIATLPRKASDAISANPTPVRQILKADQIRIPSEGRRPCVRRIAIAGRAERQHLPYMLLRRRQERQKLVRRGAKVADSSVRRQ